MEGAPRRNHTISTIAAMFVTDHIADEEMTQEFKQRTRDQDVLALMSRYENTLACRWNAQQQVTSFLEHFQGLTNSYGEHFATTRLLFAWTNSYRVLGKLIEMITYHGATNYKDFITIDMDLRLKFCVDSLRMLLEIRYQFVYLPYLGLRWSHFCRNNRCDMQIFMTAVTTVHLIDVAIKEELLLFPIIFDNTLSEHRAMVTIDTINEHKEQIKSSMWPLLESVRDQLKLRRAPSYNHVKPPKSPITYSEFNDLRFYKI